MKLLILKQTLWQIYYLYKTNLLTPSALQMKSKSCTQHQSLAWGSFSVLSPADPLPSPSGLFRPGSMVASRSLFILGLHSTCHHWSSAPTFQPIHYDMTQLCSLQEALLGLPKDGSPRTLQFLWHFNSIRQTFAVTSSTLVPELGSGDTERDQS